MIEHYVPFDTIKAYGSSNMTVALKPIPNHTSSGPDREIVTESAGPEIFNFTLILLVSTFPIISDVFHVAPQHTSEFLNVLNVTCAS